jgi:hypothetical protein
MAIFSKVFLTNLITFQCFLKTVSLHKLHRSYVQENNGTYARDREENADFVQTCFTGQKNYFLLQY